VSEPDPFRAKLLQLTLLRLSGIALAIVGLVWASSDRFGSRSPVGGAVLIVVGMIGSLALARRLRQRWLKPPE